MHRCALIGESVKCWGFNGQGQLGDGTTTTNANPDWVKEADGAIVSGVKTIGVNYKSMCATMLAGGVRC